jgi:hypothetical protein
MEDRMDDSMKQAQEMAAIKTQAGYQGVTIEERGGVVVFFAAKMDTLGGLTLTRTACYGTKRGYEQTVFTMTAKDVAAMREVIGG